MSGPEFPASPDGTSRTVVTLFDDADSAEAAVRALEAAGFRADQLGIAVRPDRAPVKGTDPTEAPSAHGAGVGAVGGGVVGGLVGLLIGVGAITAPGLGPVVAAGWLGATLAGAGVGAAAGGLIGALVKLGMSEEQARRYQDGVREGGVLLTVDAGVRADDAVAILDQQRSRLGPETAWADRTAGQMPADKTAPDLVGQGDSHRPVAGVVNLEAVEGYPGRYAGPERRRMSDRRYAGPERRAVLR